MKKIRPYLEIKKNNEFMSITLKNIYNEIVAYVHELEQLKDALSTSYNDCMIWLKKYEDTHNKWEEQNALHYCNDKNKM